MELATLGSLNPLGVDITPLTAYQLMPFKLQPKALSPSLLSEVLTSACACFASKLVEMLGATYLQPPTTNHHVRHG